MLHIWLGRSGVGSELRKRSPAARHGEQAFGRLSRQFNICGFADVIRESFCVRRPAFVPQSRDYGGQGEIAGDTPAATGNAEAETLKRGNRKWLVSQ